MLWCSQRNLGLQGHQSKETLAGAIPGGFSARFSQFLRDGVGQVCDSHALQLILPWEEGGHRLCLCSSAKPPENYPGVMHKPTSKPHLHRLHGKKNKNKNKTSTGKGSTSGA